MAENGKNGTEERDLYANLGLTKNATTEELKKAYRKLALVHHPDKFAGKGFSNAEVTKHEKEFQRISAAWEVLQDEQKRLAYNSNRRAFLERQGPPARAAARAPAAPRAAPAPAAPRAAPAPAPAAPRAAPAPAPAPGPAPAPAPAPGPRAPGRRAPAAGVGFNWEDLHGEGAAPPREGAAPPREARGDFGRGARGPREDEWNTEYERAQRYLGEANHTIIRIQVYANIINRIRGGGGAEDAMEPASRLLAQIREVVELARTAYDLRHNYNALVVHVNTAQGIRNKLNAELLRLEQEAKNAEARARATARAAPTAGPTAGPAAAAPTADPAAEKLRIKLQEDARSASEMYGRVVELQRLLYGHINIKEYVDIVYRYYSYIDTKIKQTDYMYGTAIVRIATMNLYGLKKIDTVNEELRVQAEIAESAVKKIYEKQQAGLKKKLKEDLDDEKKVNAALTKARSSPTAENMISALQGVMRRNPELVGRVLGIIGGLVQELAVVPRGNAWLQPRILVYLFMIASVYGLTGNKHTTKVYNEKRGNKTHYTMHRIDELNPLGNNTLSWFFISLMCFILKLIFGPSAGGGATNKRNSMTRKNNTPKNLTRRNNTLALASISKNQSIAVSNEIILLYDDYLKGHADDKELFVKIIRALVTSNNPMPIHDLLKQGKIEELEQYLKPEYEPFTTEGKLINILCELGINIVAEYFFAINDDKEKYAFLNQVFSSMSGGPSNAETLAEKMINTPLGNNPFTYRAALKNSNSLALMNIPPP